VDKGSRGRGGARPSDGPMPASSQVSSNHRGRPARPDPKETPAPRQRSVSLPGRDQCGVARTSCWSRSSAPAVRPTVPIARRPTRPRQELDAEMEHQTARDTTEGPPRPLGARGATMADTVGEASPLNMVHEGTNTVELRRRHDAKAGVILEHIWRRPRGGELQDCYARCV
jgi:hypothetical protein